ncbi:MAG: hypothetical protein HC880_08365 [Bacteroidia bacterium]|nr:hypothetical protein [Bacteroidia bacterium]
MNRTDFKLILADTTLPLSLNFQAPYRTGQRYSRDAQLNNPYPSESSWLRAYLEEKLPGEIRIRLEDQNRRLNGELYYITTPEEVQIRGRLNDQLIAFSRNRRTQLVQINVDETLKAVLIHQKDNGAEQAYYLLYLAPKLSVAEKAGLLNILLSEVGAEAVQKYYQVETAD